MRGTRIAMAAAAASCGLMLAGSAGAQSAVAAPGPCAEPRTGVTLDPLQPPDQLEKSRIELRGEPVLGVTEGQPVPPVAGVEPVLGVTESQPVPPVAGVEPEFAVAGGPADHFDPTDVAAPGVEPRHFEHPLQTTFTRSPCDAPDAGCFAVLPPTPATVGIIDEVEPTPEDGFPPFPPEPQP